MATRSRTTSDGMKRFLFPAVLLAASLLFVPSVSSAPPRPPAPGAELVIALIPEQNVFVQKKRHEPLGAYLSRRVGVPVRFKLLDSYEAVFKELGDRKVDGAFFGSLNFVLANLQVGVDIVARPRWVTGEADYTGYIFTRRGGTITADPATWKGKRFAFVSRATTAGYLYPLARLRAAGIRDGERYFSKALFPGSHDAAALAVFRGEADLGACKNNIFNELQEKDPAFAAEMVILSESRAVPSNGLGVRRDLDPARKAALKKALLEMHWDGEGRKVLADYKALKFIETGLADYQPVLDMAAEAGLDLRKYPVSGQYTPFSSMVPVK